MPSFNNEWIVIVAILVITLAATVYGSTSRCWVEREGSCGDAHANKNRLCPSGGNLMVVCGDRIIHDANYKYYPETAAQGENGLYGVPQHLINVIKARIQKRRCKIESPYCENVGGEEDYYCLGEIILDSEPCTGAD